MVPPGIRDRGEAWFAACAGLDWTARGPTQSNVAAVRDESAPTHEVRPMSEPAAFPYATHLNVLYQPLELVDVQALVDACTDRWYNQTLTRVNDAVVRLGVLEGEYHWHKHDNEDEFFYVVDGRFLIDLEGRSVELL